MTPGGEPTSEGETAIAKPTLHVVFNMSPAGTLRQALGDLGRHERVIGCPDDLSFGPIDPPSADLREAWIGDELGYDFDGVVRDAEVFWAEATSPDVVPVVWVSRYDAQEYAGFLEFIWRIGDAPFRVVDVTGVEYGNLRGDPVVVRSLGAVPKDAIIAAGLPDRQTTLWPHVIEAYRETWRGLKRENAPFRVIDEAGLVSVPITHFDEFLASFATDDWRPGARVVGDAMAANWEAPPGRRVSDLVLIARVHALAAAGIFDIEGDVSSIRGLFVRRS